MPSSSSPLLWEFDVFLSFRGEDTRKSFVSHLYKALDKMGIKTFKDDKELRKGKSISPELRQAIRESKFAVVVISKNYASSGWCLDELLEIVKCEENGSLKIFPVFYEVDPSDVKKQRGPFAESFRRHGRNKVNPNKLQRWKEALAKVATIAGEDSRNWREDSDLIEKVVREISSQLVSATSSDFSHLVGMERHVKELSTLLDLDSTNEVRMVGIWGMPGVGKTTLARYVYETISQRFQAHCFVEDVKKFYRENGPAHLQEVLLSKNLQEAVNIRSSQVGSNVIKARFGHQKVLVVIDDVDAIEQLHVLARDTNWFGSDSRIIVTTQNKHLLIAHRVKHVYEVKCLSNDEALQLFCMSAFKQKQPIEGFERLSIQATNYATGLPLALRVLGSFLCERSKEEWKSTFCRLDQGSLEEGITNILKASYDGLGEQEKEIFLHVACLFDGESFKDVSRVLGGNHKKAEIKIQTLAEKSLIVLSSYGRIKMHGLLQKLGRELARGRLLTDPEEICGALMDNEVNKKVEGISLDMSLTRKKRLSTSDGAFERISNLKYLKVYSHGVNDEAEVNLASGISFGNHKLKFVNWNAYPLRALHFPLDNLVVLHMRNSKLEKLWKGSLALRSLKRIDLSGSYNLREIPDVSGVPNLEDLDVTFCSSLVEVPSSINSLNELTHFKLEGCSMLVQLPTITNLKSLEVLLLAGCERLKYFPQISQTIKRLHVTFTFDIELPDSIGNMSYLVELEISSCKRLETLPNTVGNLRSLKHLELRFCEMLESIPDTIEDLVSLAKFIVIEARNIRKIPHLPPNLRELIFAGTSIEKVPSWIGNLSKLKILDLKNNRRLKDLSASISKLESLECLYLDRCSSLENLPAELCETMSLLKRLNLSNTGIKELPDNFGNLRTLERLFVNKITWGKGLSSITNLRSLRWLIVNQDVYEPNGEFFPCPPLSGCSLLEVLELKNLNMVEIPKDIGHYFPHLESLDLSGNDFHVVPASIKHLSSLMDLYLNNCRNLRSLPEVSSRVSLICAHGCDSLESASQALHQPVFGFVLSGCNRLGQEEARSFVKRWASLASRQRLMRACLPGSKVPRWFKQRAEGSSLTIHLPRSHFLRDVFGFATCVVVAAKGPYDINKFRVDIDYDFRDNCGRRVCDFRDNCDRKVYCPRRIPYPFHLSDDLFVQSEHIYLGTNVLFPPIYHPEEVFQDMRLTFHLLDKELAVLHHAKVKACGVRLLFWGDVDAECDNNGSTDETSDDEELESSNRNQEYSVPSSLSSTCGESSGGLRVPSEEAKDPPNNNRPYEFGDSERQDRIQLHSRRGNFFRFFCITCIALRVFSDLFSH